MKTAFLLLVIFSQSAFAAPDLCTYKTWTWDTVQKKSVDRRSVRKSRAQLTEVERGQVNGCSVCEEDQTELKLPGVKPFKVCKVFAEPIRRALQRAIDSGFPIQSVVGYRVGKSKGPVNAAGMRTEFSNHSFGTAIDVNSEKNGLYENCAVFGPSCRLLRGGPYHATTPGAITAHSPIYQAFLAAGFRWGGEIVGRQKDFMHFSLDGM